MSLARMAAKQSPPKSRMRSGKARCVGGEQQVRPVLHDQLLEVDHAEQALLHADFAAIGVHAVGDEVDQRFGHAGIDREMDDRTAAAPFQRRLVHAHEVLGLFLELDVGVSDQAEQALAADREAREDPLQEQADHLLEHDEAYAFWGPRQRFRRRPRGAG